MEAEQRKDFYDVVVIGGGPAGLTAAIYLARARYRVLVLEKEQFGGQITISSKVVNYPGIKNISGAALTEDMRQQAQDFGAEFLLAEAQQIEVSGEIKRVQTGQRQLQCFGVLLATGAHPRMIGFPGEKKYKGHGVAYCATCDGEFFTGMEVFVVGGGFAAAEESVFLTKYASHVTILIREEDFTCAKAVAEEARNHEKITALTNTEVVEASGDSMLRSLRYRNNQTGEETEYRAPEGKTFGIFVFAGYEPDTELVKGIVALDDYGYIITDRNQKTNVEGIYAAGDVCVKNLRQVVTAVGDGAAAATELERYVALLQEKHGIRSQQPKSEKRSHKQPESSQNSQTGSGPFDSEMLAQLDSVFSKMKESLVLKLYLDDRPISEELRQYVETLAARTEKLTVEYPGNPGEILPPCVRICRADGTYTGLAFHGVPGGHEFTSFVLGLYNAAGPGQSLDPETQEAIGEIHDPVDLKIMVSLSCTMCPELVASAQRIAAASPYVTAEAYDLNHFPALREQYQVMSVPCLVINDGKEVSFGKKNVPQVLGQINRI